MGSTFLSSGSPGARLNLALLDSAYFCHVIPLPFYYMDFYVGDLGGHEKGETGLLQSPLDYLYCALSAERSLVAFYVFDFRAEPFA